VHDIKEVDGVAATQVRIPHDLYVLLREFVREQFGIVYGASRRSIFENRVLTRVTALDLPDVEAYWRYLLFHPNREDEYLQLASVLTNNETFFFREEVVLSTVVELLRARKAPVRVLSAGASSGEELASLAMLLLETGVDLADVELQGVDLDVRMVEAARAGLYREKSFRKVAPQRIVRFFAPEGEGRRLKPAVRHHLDFRWANLVHEPTMRFPARFDVVLCRNVLIYFDLPTVERVVSTLHGLLANDGYLAVGVSESLAHIPFLFDPQRRGAGAVLYQKLPE